LKHCAWSVEFSKHCSVGLCVAVIIVCIFAFFSIVSPRDLHHLLGGQVSFNVADSQVLEGCLGGFRELTFLRDGLEEWLLGGTDVLQVLGFEVGDVLWLDLVKVTSDTAEDASNLLGDGHWAVLSLLEEFSESNTSVQELLSSGIHIGTELREGGDLTVLGKIELHRTGDLLHGLELGGGTDSGYGQTDVNGWSNTFMEQFSLQEDLAIGNTNDIGWDISGYITGLGLNDWQGGQTTGATFVAHLGSSLQETGVQVEDITWVGLTSWWSTEKEGHLSVGNGLLRQIVVHDQSVSSVVTEPFAHGATGVWSKVLQWGGVGSGGDNDDAVFQAIGLLENVNELADGGLLLANSDVDAVELLALITFFVESPLVEDGIEGDGGFTGLSITNDQLTLTTTDWDQGIDGFQTRLHRFVYGLSGNDTWGLDVDTSSFFAVDGSLAVQGVTEWINDASQELWADWDVDDSTSSSDNIAFLDVTIVTEYDNTNVVWLQVQSHTLQTALELNHLFGLDVLETVDTGDTVTNGQDLAGFLEINSSGFTHDSLLQEVGEFGSALLVGGDSRGGEASAGCWNRGSDYFGKHLCTRTAPL
jgi:hypothetical protein